jgi:hypothetical protein
MMKGCISTMQRVQSLQPDDYDIYVQFWQWMVSLRSILDCILFSDEAQFNRYILSDSRNPHSWSADNPHGTAERAFQHRFSVNIWCDPKSWPPRSPDLTPLDIFLWGPMKEMNYRFKVHTRQALLHRIVNAAVFIPEHPEWFNGQ